MQEEKIALARDLARKKPYLFWSTKNYNMLSPEVILENVLSFGNWDDFLFLLKIFGLKDCFNIFTSLTSKKRTNLRPQTINYFEKYFKHHAQGNTF